MASGCALFTDVSQAEPAHSSELVKVEGRRVLVGHSAGGLYVRVFAHMYPKEIASLVLVDPGTEETYERMHAEKTMEDIKKLGLPPAALAMDRDVGIIF